MTTKSNEKHRAEAPGRIRVVVRHGKDDWIGIAYAANAGDPSTIHEYVSAEHIASRDAEVREVLEGLSRVLRFRNGLPQRCWCEDPNSNWTHTPACIVARALYNRLQPVKEGKGSD